MVLYLILITFIVFAIFWLGDLLITLKTVKRIGKSVEVNPLVKLFFVFRGRFIYLFKLVEIGAFLYLIWFISNFDGVLPFHMLLGFILLYSLLVVNNAHVYYKVTGQESLIFKAVYVGTVLAMLAFIYLNFLLFQDLNTAYKALGDANVKYNTLYWQLQSHNKSINASLPQDLTDVLKGLNLSIRRGFG